MFYEAPPRFQAQQPTSPYHAEIMYADSEVQRVIRVLEGLGLRDNTLVVITADHGEGLNQHTEESHSFFVYESTIRVPLIFWGPPLLPRGAVVDSVVRTADIAPTILHLLEVPPFDDDIQGVSLRSLIEGKNRDLELLAYSESSEPRLTFGAPIVRAVRSGRWKYIHQKEPELYDLERDPDEARNLASERPQLAARLREDLEALLSHSPGAPADAAREMDNETRAQLMALGYASGGGPMEEGNELEALSRVGPDLHSLSRDIRLLSKAGGSAQRGDWNDALQGYRNLYERYPDSIPILAGLISVHLSQGGHEESIPLLRHVLKLRPDITWAQQNLANSYWVLGDLEAAELLLNTIRRATPCSEFSLRRLAQIARQRRDYRHELSLYERALASCEPSPRTRSDYALALATRPDSNLRDGERAVEIARAVLAAAAPTDPVYLDTLALALAEVSAFEEAVATEREAIRLLERAEASTKALEPYRRHLALLEKGIPVRIE
jgi:tetratricopeptide (TPR) repeat protein